MVDRINLYKKSRGGNRVSPNTRMRENMAQEQVNSKRDTDTSDDPCNCHLSLSNRAMVVNALKDMGLDNLAKEYSNKYSSR